MVAWSIRPFQVSDRGRIRELTIEGFDGVSVEQRIDRLCPGVAPQGWGDRKAAEVLAETDRHPTGCFVAEAAGVVIGYLTTELYPMGSQGRILNLAVDAGLRGRGLGRALIQAALDDFRSRGVSVALIETLTDNPIGSQLYPLFGFQEIARKIYFAMPLDEDA